MLGLDREGEVFLEVNPGADDVEEEGLPLIAVEERREDEVAEADGRELEGVGRRLLPAGRRRAGLEDLGAERDLLAWVVGEGDGLRLGGGGAGGSGMGSCLYARNSFTLVQRSVQEAEI